MADRAGIGLISAQATVAELVLDDPRRARLLERLGIDYCCGGKRTLAEACRRAGLDPSAVAVALAAADLVPPSAEERDWREVPLDALCAHVVEVHHARLREELPRLSGLLTRVARAHGAEDGRLVEVETTFRELRGELETHLEDEEQRLFPAILSGGAAGDPALVAELEVEHEEAGAALERLRTLTDGFDVDRARCNTHRASLDALRELELDLHRHVHEENNVLFPRALAAARGEAA
ncbi:MAG TPA: iron-sulfur cluster repair di-iron protein [Gaiellaceae bacterium]|nr:iron-sulfur cluster repair di-iron protein [Gaiellaceae bacterium]